MPTHVSLAAVQKRDACLCFCPDSGLFPLSLCFEVPPGFPLCPRLGWSLNLLSGERCLLAWSFPCDWTQGRLDLCTCGCRLVAVEAVCTESRPGAHGSRC